MQTTTSMTSSSPSPSSSTSNSHMMPTNSNNTTTATTANASSSTSASPHIALVPHPQSDVPSSISGSAGSQSGREYRDSRAAAKLKRHILVKLLLIFNRLWESKQNTTLDKLLKQCCKGDLDIVKWLLRLLTTRGGLNIHIFTYPT